MLLIILHWRPGGMRKEGFLDEWQVRNKNWVNFFEERPVVFIFYFNSFFEYIVIRVFDQ